MSDRFVEILERTHLGLAEETARLRRAGAEAARNGLPAADLPGLATVAFGGQPSDGTLRDRLAQHFVTADPAFVAGRHDEELKVLAALTLDEYLGEPSPIADVAALSLVTRSFRRSATPHKANEVLDAAEAYLAARALEIRKVRPLGGVLGDARSKGARTKARHAAASSLSDGGVAPDVQTIEALVKGTADAVSSEIDAIGTAADAALNEVSRALSAHSEEIDVLWWASNAYCNALSSKISDLDVRVAALPIAQDLFELVALTPGPYSAELLLGRTLGFASSGAAGSLSILEAVNMAPEPWREDLVGSLAEGDMVPNDATPVLRALHGTTVVEDREAWLSVYETASGFKPSATLAADQISYQLFLELSLVRAMTAPSSSEVRQ